MNLTDKQLTVLKRIHVNQDLKDFREEILQPLLEQNHTHLLESSKSNRDELIGYGSCLFDLIKIFVDNTNNVSSLYKVDTNEENPFT
jgi:hypothetical protein